MRALLLLAALAVPGSAELPGFYKQVDRIVFVVPELQKALDQWKPSGMVTVFTTQPASFQADYKGTSAESSVLFSAGRFGDVIANWLQPVAGSNAFADFLKRHGPGVFALMHRVSSVAELEAEVARMKALNVAVLQRGGMGDDGSRYVFFDTQPEGKYTIGIYYQPAIPPPAPAGARRLTQFAFIVRDEAAVSKYWAKLGWPEMSITHPKLHGLEYREKPAEFRSRLGWMRHGKVVYEWIIPEKGPSTWQDHLDRHGEGVHHLAVAVDDMDKAIAEWKKAGYAYVMGGAWGDAGRPGFGRFAYVDAQGAGGIDIELLWNYR
jgi:4-hydroxyphenylpyruvate dioxygenase-like putative hemolysin